MGEIVSYAALNILSSRLSIYSITQIFTTKKQWSTTNNNIRSNQKTLVIHSDLLALNCFVANFYSLPVAWAPKLIRISVMMLPITDMII